MYLTAYRVILILGLSSRTSWPQKSSLTLSHTHPYTYGSAPQDGRPGLPFRDDSTRKSTEDPFFDVPYAEEEVYEEPPQVEQKPIRSREEGNA